MPSDVLGLKVGASRLAAARVVRNGVPQLLQLAEGPLERGIVAGGEVRDVDSLAGALASFFEQHGLPRRAVRVGVASNRIGVRTIELLGIDDPKQLDNAVRFRAQEALPIPVAEAALDYQIVAEDTDAEGTPRTRVLLAVAYRDLVDGYVQACTRAGLGLVGVDLEAFALLRALTPAGGPPAPGGERSALVAVAVGAESSTLAVSDGVTCEFTRVLDWGGTTLTAALARELQLELDVAERVKRELALDGGEVPEGLTPEQAERARETTRAGLLGFARELVSSLEFYQSQPESLGLGELVLAGGGACLGGLAPALERLIGIGVRIADPLVGVSVAPTLDRGAAGPSLAVPIGLGMGT